MFKTNNHFQKLLLRLLVFALMWALFAFAIHTALLDNTLGADFATFWIGSRAALLEGETPYSAEVTTISQQFIYHRPALPEEDQLAFAYPLPAVFLLLPVAWMNLDWAQAFWLALNILALLSTLFILFPKTAGYLRFTYFLFYPVVFGLILGNFAILISVFILIFLQGLLLNKNRPAIWMQVIAGICLAFCIIKPQFAWAYLLLAGLMGLRQKLCPFLTALASSAIILFVGSLILVHDWPLQWFKRVSEYATYVKGQPALTILLGHVSPQNLLSPLAMGITLLVVVLSFWMLYRWWQGHLAGLSLVVWVGFVTYLFHPHGISYEQITFILPFTLWVLNTQGNKISGKLLWFFAIALSWLLFFLTFWQISPIAVNEFPFLFYIVWMLYFFFKELRSIKDQPVTAIS